MVSGGWSAAGSEESAASGCGLKTFALEGASGSWARENGQAAAIDNKNRQSKPAGKRILAADRGSKAGADNLDPGAPAMLKMNFTFIITRYARRSGRLSAHWHL